MSVGVQTKKTEDERILSLDTAVHLEASTEEEQKTLQWLKGYREMELVVRDFKKYEEDYHLTAVESDSSKRVEDDELHADKTGNASIIAQGQRELYDEAKVLTTTLQRAVGLIGDTETRDVIFLRYMQGYSYKETLSFMKRGIKSATVDRRLKAGLVSVANTLKKWNVFNSTWNF